MVLVDTSIWVSHFRHGDAHLEHLLNNAQVVIHDFIIGELACGHLKARKEILSLLHALPSMPVVGKEELLYFIEQKHLVGRGMGFVDVHLLASAQLSDGVLWTLDKRLQKIATTLDLAYRSS